MSPLAKTPREDTHRKLSRSSPVWVLLAELVAATSAHAAIDTRLIYDFSVQGDIAGNTLNSRFRIGDKGRVDDMTFRLSGRSFNSQAGQVSANWDELGFASRSFRGLQLGTNGGALQANVLGGNVALTDPTGRTFLSPVYGGRLNYAWNKKWNLSASHLLTPQASAAQGKTLSILSLGFQPDKHSRVGLEWARSQHGTGWQLSAARNTRNLQFNGLLRRADAEFSTAGNPLLETQRSGHLVQINGRIAKPLNFAITHQRFRDAWNGRNNLDMASLQWTPEKLPTFRFYWRNGEDRRLPSTFFNLLAEEEEFNRDTALIRTSSQAMGVQLSHSVGRANLMLGLERNHLQTFDGSPLERSSNRFNFGLLSPIGKRDSVSLWMSHDLSVASRAGSNQKNSYAQVNWKHPIGKRGMALTLGLQAQQGQLGSFDGRQFAGQIGFTMPVNSETSMEIDFRSNLSASGFMRSQAPDRLQLRFRRNLRFGNTRNKPQLSKDQRAKMGRIQGRIFEDLNVNGRWDTGEPGLAEMPINLGQNRQLRTGAPGTFSFADLPGGNYTLQMPVKTLPVEYTMLVPSDVKVKIVPGQTTTLDFPVMRVGKATGVVFLDSNRNCQRDAGEEGVANAIVRVEGSDIVAFSDETGSFSLESLAPKSWNLQADTSLLNTALENTGSGFVSVNIPANGEITNLALGVAPVQRKVISTFRKTEG